MKTFIWYLSSALNEHQLSNLRDANKGCLKITVAHYDKNAAQQHPYIHKVLIPTDLSSTKSKPETPSIDYLPEKKIAHTLFYDEPNIIIIPTNKNLHDKRSSVDIPQHASEIQNAEEYLPLNDSIGFDHLGKLETIPLIESSRLVKSAITKLLINDQKQYEEKLIFTFNDLEKFIKSISKKAVQGSTSEDNNNNGNKDSRIQKSNSAVNENKKGPDSNNNNNPPGNPEPAENKPSNQSSPTDQKSTKSAEPKIKLLLGNAFNIPTPEEKPKNRRTAYNQNDIASDRLSFQGNPEQKPKKKNPPSISWWQRLCSFFKCFTCCFSRTNKEAENKKRTLPPKNRPSRSTSPKNGGNSTTISDAMYDAKYDCSQSRLSNSRTPDSSSVETDSNKNATVILASGNPNGLHYHSETGNVSETAAECRIIKTPNRNFPNGGF